MTVQKKRVIIPYSDFEKAIIKDYYPKGGADLVIKKLKQHGFSRTYYSVMRAKQKFKIRVYLEKKQLEYIPSPFVLRFTRTHIDKYSCKKIMESLDSIFGHKVSLENIEYIKSNLI